MKKGRLIVLLLLVFSVSTVISGNISAGELGDSEGLILRQKLAEKGIINFKLDLNVRVPVPANAGCKALDLWGTLIRPSGGEKLPTILVATPYRREIFSIIYAALINYGYNLFLVDIRGTGSSEGAWTSFDLIEHYDTAHVVDKFIPAQSWSDGRVGMIGPSYMAIIQMLAAGLIERNETTGEPTHLKALFPLVPMSDPYRDIVLHGGNVDLEFIPLWLGMVDILGALPSLLMLGEEGLATESDFNEAMDAWTGHLTNIDDTIGWILDLNNSIDGPFFDKKSPMIYWPDKPEGGWGFVEGEKVIPSKLPVFMLGGWFDIFTRGTLNNYQYGLKNHAVTDKALVVGELYHLGGSLGMGLSCIMDMALPARWFDWKIKGKRDSFMEKFPVMLYVMGENRWRAEKSWPLPADRVSERRFYLSKAEASVISGDWFTADSSNILLSLTENLSNVDLSSVNPILKHEPHKLKYHGLTSRSSSRWLMGIPALFSQFSKHFMGNDINAAMPFEDERSDESGALTFTTEPLQEDLEIAGPMVLRFWARTDFTNDFYQWIISSLVEDTQDLLGFDTTMLDGKMLEWTVQWVVEVNDVFSDGRARNITSGWLNATHRQYDPDELSITTEHALDPGYTPFDPFYDRPDREPCEIEEGELYQYAVEIWPTCNVFKKGHRVRLSISNSDFPHLLPVVRPSANTIVIDDEHLATLDFTGVNKENEGSTWKWIDSPSTYLMTHRDRSLYVPSEDSDDEDSETEETIVQETTGEDYVSGCASPAEASWSSGSVAGMNLGAFLELILFPFFMVFVTRLIRRR